MGCSNVYGIYNFQYEEYNPIDGFWGQIQNEKLLPKTALKIKNFLLEL